MNLLSLIGAVGLSAVCGLTPLDHKKNAFVIDGDSYSFHSDYDNVYEYFDRLYAGSDNAERYCFYYTGFNMTTHETYTYSQLSSASQFDHFDKVINYCNSLNFALDIGYIDYFTCFWNSNSHPSSTTNVSWYRVYLSSYLNDGRYIVNGETFMVNADWYLAPCYFDDEDSGFKALFVDNQFYYSYSSIVNHQYSLSLYGMAVNHDYQHVNFYPLDDLYFYNYVRTVGDYFGWLDVNYGDVLVTFIKYLESDRSYNEGYDDGYRRGFDDGYYNGYDSGNANGIQTGYDNGYTTGYNTGFTNGVAESNDYTFTGLFGAVADTPVLIIRNLFNFDLFGVNMLSVILSLFTGLIIFYLLRKLL